MELGLNPHHDIEALARKYAKDGIVRIENLFAQETAEAIYQVLANQTPWHLVHSDALGKHSYYRPEEWAEKPQPEKNRILTETMERAVDGFAYLYLCYPMIRAYLEKRDQTWPLHRMTEFLNTPEMLDFTRAITGESTVNKHDAQATLYSRGHFLNVHDDTGDSADRRAAYVMGFTKNWRLDWGGNLLFLDGQDIGKGFVPSFNTLTLFKVPREHIVTQVSNFAGAGRFSITGWLRDDPK